MNSLFDLPFEDAPLDPEDLKPIEPPPAPTPPAPPASAPARPRVFSVSELTHAVRGTLEQTFARVWVEGEIADCANSGGHIYFTLKDQQSQLKAVLWRTDAVRLRFKLTTGLHVLVKGRLSVFAPRGVYQLMADSIEPRGEGALRLAFEQLRTRLRDEGLFAAARKRRLPLLPRRIGVVTSLDGAAVRDVVRVLRTRRAPADIVISPTRVQGDGAAAEIARAIARVSRVPGVDVLIVGRGGGSLEDLWAFNEEVVARAIAAAPVPVIAAVGHETDTTIADFVADVRAATPSQAAELVVRQAGEFRDRLAGARRQLTLLLGRRLDRRRTVLLQLERRPAFARFAESVFERDRLRADLLERLQRTMRGRMDDATRRVADLRQRVDQQHPQRQLTTRLRRLMQVDERLLAAARTRVDDTRSRLQQRRDRLARAGLDGRVASACRRVDAAIGRARTALIAGRHRGDRQLSSLSARLDALSPLKTLGRGYAICWETPGLEVVRSATAVQPGQRVHVQLADGMLQCEVHATTPDDSSRT